MRGSRRTIAAAAAALAAAACAVSLAACSTPSGAGPGPTSSSPAPVSASSTPPTTTPATNPPASTADPTTTAAPATTSTTTTTSPATTTTSTTAPKPPAVHTLSIGDTGPAVLALQQRLSSLGYWLGTPDGVFGDSTQQAVYALQKAAGLGRDGVVGPATEAALTRGAVPTPRPASGLVVEVDLATDLVMIVDNGKLEYTLNTSTGGGYTYTTDGATYVANTPVGVFHIYRVDDGMVVDSLGALWRPRYFDSGFAIHGDSYVPPEPVSHGCVRLSDEAIDWVWDDNIMPMGTEVWVF